MREELQISKRSKQVDDLPPLGPPTDPYALMSYLGLPAAFRPWSPSKGPPGGYPLSRPASQGLSPSRRGPATTMVGVRRPAAAKTRSAAFRPP